MSGKKAATVGLEINFKVIKKMLINIPIYFYKGETDDDIQHRFLKAKRAFGPLNKIWAVSLYSPRTKLRIFNNNNQSYYMSTKRERALNTKITNSKFSLTDVFINYLFVAKMLQINLKQLQVDNAIALNSFKFIKFLTNFLCDKIRLALR